MNSNHFLKRFYEIEAGKKLPHLEESYSSISFDVMITPDVPKKNYIIVFSGQHSIFPIILEFPRNEHHLKLGLVDIFFIAKNKVREGKKKIKFLELIDEYIKANNLIDLDKYQML